MTVKPKHEELGKISNFLDRFPQIAPISVHENEGSDDDLFANFSPKKEGVVGSQKSQAELIAENEVMRNRLETMEKRPGKERRSNYFLRVFIDALPNFCFSFDANGRILQVLTGGQVSARVLEGRSLTELLPQTDAEELGDLLRKTYETGEVQDFDFIMSVQANRRWYRVKSHLVTDKTGKEKIAVFLLFRCNKRKISGGRVQKHQSGTGETKSREEEKRGSIIQFDRKLVAGDKRSHRSPLSIRQSKLRRIVRV